MDTTDETLKARAEDVYKFVHDYLFDKAMSPTHREICKGLGVCTETVAKAIAELKRQGRDIIHIKGRGRQLWVPINKCPDEKEE